MYRARSISESEVVALADRLGVALHHDERGDVVDRVNSLLTLYRRLEDAPRRRGDGATDRFASPPRDPDDDPHNAWIARFELLRADADGSLSGIDVAIKDNICVRGVELTNGSRAFEGFVPESHATAVDRLLDAGATITGKTNMDELAFGPTSETSAYGPTENPGAAGHVAGGSSGGSAAAVAAGDVDLALGTDTGGSVRIPASYCGIVGVKPTYGRAPRYGVAPLAHSMDHVGVLAPDVETAARGLDVLSDPPPGAEETADTGGLGTDLAEVTIGVPDAFFEEHVVEGVQRRVERSIDDLADAGATVEAIEVPGPDETRPVWWGIAPAEFAATYVTNASGFFRRGPIEPSLAAAIRRVRATESGALGENVKSMLALGARLNDDFGGYHYVRARNRRADLTRAYRRAFETVDVMATPSTPTVATEVGGFVRGVSPPVNWNTHPTNLTGHPSLSLPCGDLEGRPVGLQLVAPWHEERTLLDVAREYERL